MNSVKIVIPLYKTDLNETEIMSLKRSIQVLSKHQFTIVCPNHLEINSLGKYFENLDWEVKRFSDHFFKNIDGYNQLMLSEVFYEAFSDVDYILICQTDVFVTEDQLEEWVLRNYDYIGAPWIGTPRTCWNNALTSISNNIKKIIGKKTKEYSHLFKVGNGGFSLRKVKKHLEIVSKHQALIQNYLNHPVPENYQVEDVFFSLKVPQLEPDFHIPDWKIALNFCVDRKPKLALKLNNNQLPFAFHGFDKPKVKAFWSPIIAKLKH